MTENTLPEGSQDRKDIPVCTGFLDYFPAAIAYAAMISKVGNDKHNPGEPLHHARGKSMDHADCILRHQMDRGGVDDQGIRHSGYVLWRAAAQLQEELEAAGEAPLPRGARPPEDGLKVTPSSWTHKEAAALDGATPDNDILERQFYTGPAAEHRCSRTFHGDCFEEKYLDQQNHSPDARCDECPLKDEPAIERPPYTVKPVPRHQYDPESTVGGW